MKLNLVAGLTAGVLLIFGMIWLVGLLVVMNDVPEAKAMPILVSYLVLVIVTVIGAGIAASRASQTLVTTHHWNIWVSGLVILVGLGLAGAIIQVIGSLVLMLAFGVR